jgi:glycosyltransferase involved in cell wall biosynthesis
MEFAGGVGRCVSNLLREMPRADADVEYRFIDTRGSRHIAFSPIFFAAAMARLAWLSAAGRVDVVHANVSARGSALRKLHVALLVRALRTPFVLHLHDGRFDVFYEGLPEPGRRAVRWMFRAADHVVVLSARWERFVVEELGVARGCVDIIPNAVPRPPQSGTIGASAEAPVPRRPTGEAGPPHLVFLGRLWEPKGVSDLLDALASQCVKALDWKATLAGDGDPAPYEDQAQRLGISERVSFLGWQGRAEVDRLLGQADVLVLPSHVEGLPMVVLEALACRVPVVATSVGAIPEYLVHGDSALLVGPREVGALGRALAAVIRSPELRARLAARGEEVHRRHFDLAVAASRIASVYRKVARPKGASTASAAAGAGDAGR